MNTQKIRKNLYLFGSYRSGTTWMMKLFATGFDKQFDFEPLEPAYNARVKEFRLRNRFLNPNHDYPGYERALEDIVSGKVINPYTKCISSSWRMVFRWKFWAGTHVIKIIQGHLLMGYLVKKYQIQNVIHIIRHPCGVIESLKRQRWWASDIEEFLDFRREALFSEYPELHHNTYKALGYVDAKCSEDSLKKVGYTAIRWCLENIVPLKQKYDEGFPFYLLKYEDFLLNPGEELESIKKNVTFKFHPKVAGSKKNFFTGKKRIFQNQNRDKWKQFLGKEERVLIRDVLACFKMDNYVDYLIPVN